MRPLLGFIPLLAISASSHGAANVASNLSKFGSSSSNAPRDSQRLANALWNGPSEDGAIGLWLYQTNGTCHDLRKNEKQVIAISVPSKALETPKELARSDLGYCMELRTLKPVPEVIRCSKVTLRITRAAAGNAYVGAYSITLQDGTVRTGTINAQYCPAPPQSAR